MPSCPTRLTCLLALRAHVLFVPACLCFLRPFLFFTCLPFFYVPYAPYVPSFFTCFTCLSFFLRALRALILLSVSNFRHAFIFDMPWCSGYHYCTASFNKAWTQVLRGFKTCSRRVGDSRWWGSLTMVPAGNKAKRLSSVSHTTKTIHQFIIIKDGAAHKQLQQARISKSKVE